MPKRGSRGNESTPPLLELLPSRGGCHRERRYNDSGEIKDWQLEKMRHR